MAYQPKVIVIGASNVDITGFTKNKLIYQDANIGSMKTSAGGVGRNIAENLVKLNCKVSLISVFGDDPLSSFIIRHNEENGISIDNSLVLENASASTFIAVMDEHNDLAVGISAMEIYDEINVDYLLEKFNPSEADYIVLETNFDENVLQAVVAKSPNAKIVLDTVSGKKALRALPILNKLYILKTNLLEAEIMSNMTVNNETDKQELVNWFLNKGVTNVFITMGKEGVIYGNADGIKTQESIHAQVVNTIGAGDSFVAGLIYADSQQHNIDQCAKYGMAAAAITVGHNEAVSPKLSIEKLNNLI